MEDGRVLVLDGRGEYGVVVRFLGGEEADDVSHMAVILSLVGVRDGLEAGEPVGMGVGAAEVFGGSGENHGDKVGV